MVWAGAFKYEIGVVMKLGWAKIINKYIGKPYNFGIYDCYTFICGVMEDQGYTVDHDQKIGVFNESNYMEISNHELLNKILDEWITSNSDEIKSSEAEPGDIVMVKMHKNLFPAILSTNSQVVACILGKGVKVIHYCKIKQYRRWRNK